MIWLDAFCERGSLRRQLQVYAVLVVEACGLRNTMTFNMPTTTSTDSKEMNDAESSSQSEDMQIEAGSRIRTGEDDEDDVEENAEGQGESSNSPTPGTLTALEERKSRMERLRKKIVRPIHCALYLTDAERSTGCFI